MVYKIFLGILVESYGTWLLFQRLDDSSKDSDIPKNVPFAFAINTRNTLEPTYNKQRKHHQVHHMHLIFSPNCGEIQLPTANSNALNAGLMLFFSSRSSMRSAYSP